MIQSTKHCSFESVRTIALMLIAISGICASVDPVFGAACSTSICTGSNPCTISGTNAITDGCVLNFGTGGIKITGTVKSEYDGGSFTLIAGSLDQRGTIQAKEGFVSLILSGAVTAQSGWSIDVSGGGALEIIAGGAVSTTGGSISADGSGGEDAGYVLISGASITTSSTVITADSSVGGSGGEIDLASAGGISIGGNVSAKASGLYAPGGTISIEAGPSGAVVVDAGVTATGDQDGVDGDISIDDGCSVAITGNGALKTKNGASDGYGTVSISSRGTISIASASQVRADGNSANFMFCRCVDANHDQICDSGCVSSPTGVTTTNVQPSPEVDAVAIPPCGCGDGTIGAGEQCDDGNNVSGDGCSYDCRIE